MQRLVPQQVSHPPAEGAEAGEKLPPGVASRLQAQVDQLQEERCTLREDLTQLRLALQHSQQQGGASQRLVALFQAPGSDSYLFKNASPLCSALHGGRTAWHWYWHCFPLH